ncbi:retrotransposon protein, putative, ty1-copia subclass [Tanacetum coccineum]
MGKTISELHAMLKLHEKNSSDKNNVPSLHAFSLQRNCPQYLAELLKNKKLSQGASGSGSTTQCLRASRKLKPGALSLYVGNGQRAEVEAIGSYHLSLPSGLVIVLNNCHYAPSITRGIISVSCLYDDGYVNRFVDNSIQVSRNNMIYFSAVPRDGIFEIDLSDSYTNVSSIYALSNKRSKSNLDSALLWHCRLGHISKKRIEKLQHDGLLNSTDLKAFEKYVPCMSGKMARKPYTHQVERAKDLLGLIHTDVCGPFKIMSRQGANYFVTFTDDFSRYGYVYLLKHKHEVFETFKVFQKEVESSPNRSAATAFSIWLPTKRLKGTPCKVWLWARPKLFLLKSLGLCGLWRHVKRWAIPSTTHPRTKYLLLRNVEFLENSLIAQEASGSLEDLEIIQEEDTHPFLDTSLNHEAGLI